MKVGNGATSPPNLRNIRQRGHQLDLEPRVRITEESVLQKLGRG